MKKITIVVCILMLVAGVSLAQSDNRCEKILQDGLYSNFRITNTGNFNQDFRTYLLSEQFKQDLRQSKWGGSITIPIEGIPISLGANASEAEFSAFRQRVLQATSFSVSESSYQSIVSSIPNVDLARVYTDCVERTRTFGFKVNATSGEKWVSFVITYTPEISTDPLPKVRTIDVRNGSNVKTALVVGQPIANYNSVVSDRDPKMDLLLFLDTDRGVATYKIPAESPQESSKDMPVGTIITSYLNVEQFYAATKNNEFSPGGVWTSEKSKWSPADGRVVPNSQFQKIASQERVPDLRGMFLRGLNIMEAVPQVPLDFEHKGRKDMENRSVGSYQPDSIKKHTHELNNGSFNLGYKHPSDNLQGGNNRRWWFPEGRWTITVKDTGQNLDGEESRPKNVAAYYYIRIN